ncbi:hypothetical protein M405DRAFT_693744, partial [Rhizopogon salebrosus TDB-379]
EQKVAAVTKERDYKNHDIVTINKEGPGDEYETNIKDSYHEHMHEDEEIRYLLEG